MAGYMPQDLFDIIVVTSIKLHIATGNSLDDVRAQIWEGYRKDFPDDAHVQEEIREAASKVLDAMRTQFNDEQLPSAMTQLQYCITNFELNGKRKRKRLLNGIWFTRTKSPQPNRSKDCLRNMVVYHTGTMTGMFPIAPERWSL